MPHIHTEPGQHDFTTSAFIVRTDFDEPKIMLHKHKRFNMWLQFGGHVELHESPWQAVEHEILEEIGYEFSQLKLLQPSDRFKGSKYKDLEWHPVPFAINTHKIQANIKHFHTDISYAFITSQKPKHPIAEGESTEIKLFSIAELINKPCEMHQANAEMYLYVLQDLCSRWDQIILK